MTDNNRAPGVYLTEAPLTSPPEELGNAVAVGVFVGAASKGPIDSPTLVESWSDYVSIFGGFTKTEGIDDDDDSTHPTTTYIATTAAALLLNSTAQAGDLGFVNPYRGTAARFYRYEDAESAEDGFDDPHVIYVFNGTAWVDTTWRYDARTKLFRDRTSLLPGGVAAPVQIVVVDADPTVTAPAGLTARYGDIALHWNDGTDQYDVYVYGSNSSTYFDGTGTSEGVFTVTLTAAGAGDEYDLTIDGVTGTIPATSTTTTGAVTTAIEAFANVAVGDFVVTKTGTTAAVFTFTATDSGTYANTDLTTLTMSVDDTDMDSGGSSAAVLDITIDGGSSDVVGAYDATHAAADTQIALPVGWNPMNATTQGNATGLDSVFSSDNGVADLWGPFLDDSPAYSDALDINTVTGLELFVPTFDTVDDDTPKTIGFSYLPYSVYNFFANNGRNCYIIRSVDHSRTGARATFDYLDKDGGAALTVRAKGAGVWGNKIGVLITQEIVNVGTSLYSYTVRVFSNSGTLLDETWNEEERFTDLSMFGDTPGLRRIDLAINDGSAGSRLIEIVDMASQPLTSTTYAALIGDNITNLGATATATENALVGGVDPGLPQEDDFIESAYENVSRISGPVLVNVAGLTTDVNDYTAFRSALLTTSNGTFGDRSDIVVINDGFAPKGPRSTESYIAAIQSAANTNTRVDSHVADYFPWIWTRDPAVPSGSILTPPGGAVMGVIARTDSNEGVFRAPAGAIATTNAIGVEVKLNNRQQGDVNSDNLNLLKDVPGNGFCIMGARTRKFYGADKYLSVRRTLIFIETQLANSSAFAVFENNDEVLWGRLALTADRILRPLWASGGLKGGTAAEAYYIKCDNLLNTPQVIASGEVRMEVGVALQTPAEFVVIRVSQFDGGTSATEIQPQ